MRTTFITNWNGDVTISYDDVSGERRTRTFFCPPTGGHVRESKPDGHYPQVCDGLAASGPTLMAPSRDSLIGVIRRAYRRMRRSDARWMSR